MRRWARWTAVALGVLGAALAVPTTAHAEVGVDDVVSALGLASEPADYVVLVDTSGSMTAGGRYQKVRSELGRLVRGLAADDRVSLLTFDTRVSQRFRGVVGKHPDAVVAKLPKKAAGKHTDIGAAIAAGLTQLEKADTHRLAALILITDGKVDAPGSTYKNPKSSAWQGLQTRASALEADHQVAAYAVALQASTDAGLLKKVFPQATEVSASQVGARFAQVGGDLVRLQAAEALKQEVAQPITVAWAGDLGHALAEGGSVDAELTFSSPYAHVPVMLTDVQPVASDGLTVTIAGLPDEIVLEPGQDLALPVQVAVSGSAGWSSTVGLSATVSSPWRDALTDQLGVEFAPAIEGTAPIPAAPIKLPPSMLPTLASIAGALAGLAALLWLVRLVRTPRMNGLLSVRAGDRDLADIPVHGRRMKIEAPEAATELKGLSGTVSGRRLARGQNGVAVDLRFGAERARGPIADGATVPLGEMTVTFTSKRRRILDKIGFPEAAASAESGNALEDVPRTGDLTRF